MAAVILNHVVCALPQVRAEGLHLIIRPIKKRSIVRRTVQTMFSELLAQLRNEV